MKYDVNIKIWFRNPKIKRFAVFKNHKIVTRKIRMENNNKKYLFPIQIMLILHKINVLPY